MSDENILEVEQTPESLAAEEAAFAASFSEARGIEQVEPKEPEAAVVAEEVPPADAPAATEPPAAVVPPDAPVQKPLTIAGLTEEQIAAALAKNSSLQSTVDKMAGRMGQIMQQIEQLRTNPPTTQAAQKAFDVKLDKLSAAFPELAALLQEDLKSAQTVAGDPAPALPQGITQEQFDAILNERLSASAAEIGGRVEERVLGIIHPDWEQVIRTPQFALWRDNVLPPGEGQKLMVSEDANFISKGLTAFKEWSKPVAPVVEAPPPAVTAPAQVSRSQRLSNAVLPAGGAPAPQNPVTEEDSFLSGFTQERKRGGR